MVVMMLNADCAICFSGMSITESAVEAGLVNEGAIKTIERAMEREPKLKVTLPNSVNDEILEDLF